MSKTREISQGKVISASDTMTLLDQASLPAISTVRFSRTLSNVEEAIREINEGITEVRENHIKTDEDGDQIVEVVLSETGETVGEAAIIEDDSGGREYKDLDLKSMDFDFEDEYRLSEDDYEGEFPETQDRYVFDDEEEMEQDHRDVLQDKTEIEVHPFPEDEVEDVLSAFKEELVRDQIEEIETRVDLSEEEVRKIEDVLSVPNKDTRLRASEIKDITFLFPEDI